MTKRFSNKDEYFDIVYKHIVRSANRNIKRKKTFQLHYQVAEPPHLLIGSINRITCELGSEKATYEHFASIFTGESNLEVIHTSNNSFFPITEMILEND